MAARRLLRTAGAAATGNAAFRALVERSSSAPMAADVDPAQAEPIRPGDLVLAAPGREDRLEAGLGQQSNATLSLLRAQLLSWSGRTKQVLPGVQPR